MNRTRHATWLKGGNWVWLVSASVSVGSLTVLGQAVKPYKERSAAPVPITLSVPSGRRLKELAPIDGSSGILVGGSINFDNLGTASETIAFREFDYLTPGNEFKQSGIHPEPGIWKWTKPDGWIERSRQRGQILRLHAPIGPQCSEWARRDERTAKELSRNLEDYVSALCKRYNGQPHVRWMDVVNETVTDQGEWFGPKPGTNRWENPWTKIGFDNSDPLRPPLYIKRSFELANEHAPQIKLLINQHAGMESAMWNKVQETVLYLRRNGLRVDGIGWQAHVDAGWEKGPGNLRALDELIDWAHAHRLEFHVTENTVWLREGNMDYEAQAATFGAIVRTLIAHREKGVVTWNAWQMREDDTKKQGFKGTMFDNDGKPKAAYYSVQNELAKMAPTQKP